MIRVSTIAPLMLLIGLLLPVASANSQTTQEKTTETEAAGDKLEPLAAAIKNEIERRLSAVSSKALKKRISEIQEYYEEKTFEPIWVENGAPRKKSRALVEVLNAADEHGLHPEDYDALALFQKLGAGNNTTLADLEVHLSTSLVSFAQHTNAGRTNPRAVNRETVIYPEALSPASVLSGANSTRNMKAFLRLLAPHTPRYERARIALASYRKLAEQGGWPTIPKGEVLKPGMEDPRVPSIRKRLSISGDFRDPPDDPSPVYDPPLVNAVKYFQKRHGLAIDGVIGGNTLAEMNVSVEDRIQMLELNIERRRWMQDDYGANYLFANLADQVLKVVRNGKTVFAELIQVGLPYHRTPVFSDELEYIEINPYWNVPKSIAVNELLPKLLQNASALSSQNFEVLSNGNVVPATSVPWYSYSKANFPVRLRQRPGTDNALGRIKFMFPNEFNVYIHDTPSKSKFNRASRYFSHGCLRLNDPLRMAEVILGEQGWTRDRIDKVVNSRERTVVKLDSKIPVHIAYLTAWVNKDGSVHFRRDVYGRDPILAEALAKVRGR